MRRGTAAATAVVIILAFVPACGGPASDRSPWSEPTPSSAVTPPRTGSPSPAGRATPDPTSARPSPDRRRDQAAVREALVSAADLGSPWVAGDQAGNAAEACPGQRSALEELSFLGLCATPF